MRNLRAIRTAATINTHFIVLSSLCTDIGSRKKEVGGAVVVSTEKEAEGEMTSATTTDL